jgi:hypothetical protein
MPRTSADGAHLGRARCAQGLHAALARELLAEIEAGPGNPVWRDAGDGRGITLVATDAAQDAVGIEAQAARLAGTTAGVVDEPATDRE